MGKKRKRWRKRPKLPIPFNFELKMSDKVMFKGGPGTEPTTWKEYVERLPLIPGLTDSEVQAARSAYSALEYRLGFGFLNIVARGGHPLSLSVELDGTRNRKFLTEFGLMVGQVIGNPRVKNNHNLKKKLKRPHEFGEAEHILSLVSKFIAGGFSVEVEPEFVIKGNKKHPDFMLVAPDTNERLVVEATALHSSDNERAAHQTLHLFHTLFASLPKNILSAVRILRVPSIEELRGVTQDLALAVSRVLKEHSLVPISSRGVLEAGLAHERKRDKLEEWARAHDTSVGGVGGPPINIDEVFRTQRALYGKCSDQLPPGLSGVVMAKNAGAQYPFTDALSETVPRVEEVLADFDHVWAAVISGGVWTQEQNVVIEQGGCVYIDKNKYDYINEKHLLVRNPAFAQVLRPSVEKRFLASLMKH